MLMRDQAVLAVVDFQDKLMPEQKDVTEPFLGNAVKLIEVARRLGLPILVTEQYPERLGGSTPRIAEALGGLPRLGKTEFSCFANAGFREALENCGRRQCLVMGMETHICVMQTALGLKEAGYTPYVVRDAALAMKKAEHKAGLERLRQEGVPLITTQMAIFELLRAAGTPEFKDMLPLLK